MTTHHITESVERTMAGETVHGIPVRAYVQDVDTPMGTADRFCSHWSTPGAGAKNLTRLFAEEDVLAVVAERDALRARLGSTEAFVRKGADRIEALEAENARLRNALEQCEVEIDGCVRQEYPGDHPVHERYRQRGFSGNPARIALAPIRAAQEGKE